MKDVCFYIVNLANGIEVLDFALKFKGFREFLCCWLRTFLMKMLMFFYFLIVKGRDFLKTKQITFSALALALAIVISTVIKLPSLPSGGSITLFSMLVISVVGYWYGATTGIIVAVVYGVLQFIIEPYFLHPLQVILDYPLAFGALGLSGFFSKKKNGLIFGYIVGVIGRLIFHEISGLIFFTSYVDGFGANLTVVFGTLFYNASYVLTEGAITLLLFASPAVRNMFERLKRLAL